MTTQSLISYIIIETSLSSVQMYPLKLLQQKLKETCGKTNRKIELKHQNQENSKAIISKGNLTYLYYGYTSFSNVCISMQK